MHRKGTGVENDLILENLRRMTASRQARVWIRIPLSPGNNDSEEHARAVANAMAKISVEKVSLLAYHEWGKPKYGFLGKNYPFEGEALEDPARPERIGEILESAGLSVTIGH